MGDNSDTGSVGSGGAMMLCKTRSDVHTNSVYEGKVGRGNRAGRRTIKIRMNGNESSSIEKGHNDPQDLLFDLSQRMVPRSFSTRWIYCQEAQRRYEKRKACSKALAAS